MVNVVRVGGYTVSYDYDKKQTTIERKVGSVHTTTTLGWLEGTEYETIELINIFRMRDKKMLDYAHRLGLKY